VGAAIELPKVKNTLAERFLDKRSTRLMIDREPPLAEACHGNTHDY